ncbi:MAG: dNTP triphosphohydrolase [Rhodospirillaceae bacterium]|nr:dNTP triphosphohydrolase [Rhodospirillaceae bacterium]
MHWPNLLKLERLNRPCYEENPDRSIYVQDLDRIAFCAPFRRLANKTQVHPLYDNDHIHHRLIHSVETASVGRSLGMAVGRWLEESEKINTGEKHVVSGLVQAACLAHDIGNPPFGHSGETAIGQWFDEKFHDQDDLFGDIDDKHRMEFCKFEGNAQGFRILTRLEMYRNRGGMQLSHGVLGAFTKYPVTAHVKSTEKSDYCGLEKFGIFDSEKNLFEEVASSLGLPSEESKNGRWWRRHPLVFLVEAADDICYNVMDVEDAYASGDLDFETVVAALSPLAGKVNLQRNEQLQEECIAEMRAMGIGAAVEACVEAFGDNYDLIMAGKYSSSLLEDSRKADQFEQIKNLARSRIFKGRRKTELEVFGRNVIHRVLEGVLPVFHELRRLNWKIDDLGSYSEQVVRAINLDIRDVTSSYTALHATTDYVSGMTDRYSVKVAEMLAGR